MLLQNVKNVIITFQCKKHKKRLLKKMFSMIELISIFFLKKYSLVDCSCNAEWMAISK